MSDQRNQLIQGLEHEVGVLVRRLKRVIGERARLVHEDLTPAGYLMLSFVAEQGPARPSQLVDKFALDKGAVSRHIQTLDELGLVDKQRDPEDGRAWVVTATAEATARLKAVVDSRRARLDGLLGDWSEGDLERFVATLARYNAALGID